MKFERDLVEIDPARMCGIKRGSESASSATTANKERSLVLVGI